MKKEQYITPAVIVCNYECEESFLLSGTDYSSSSLLEGFIDDGVFSVIW